MGQQVMYACVFENDVRKCIHHATYSVQAKRMYTQYLHARIHTHFQAGKDWFKAISEQARLDYKVQYLTEYCTGPRDATVVGGVASGKMADRGQGNMQNAAANKLPLEVSFMVHVCVCVCMYALCMYRFMYVCVYLRHVCICPASLIMGPALDVRVIGIKYIHSYIHTQIHTYAHTYIHRSGPTALASVKSA
jgi:hypothetical protein